MSTAHISDELPRLLTGEANRDAVLDAAEHLRGCPDCQQDLVSAVVAHASLASAFRFAPEVVNPVTDEHPAPTSISVLPALPDLSGIFAQAREESEVEASRPARRRRMALVSVAAAAVIASGAVAVTQIGGSSTPAPSATSVALTSSVSGQPGSIATIVGNGRLKIDATALPALDSRHQYEVWLTSKQTADHPQSIGFIDGDRKADLKVPAKIMSQYSIIAVSRQGLHQTEYSGQLVLHGSYQD